MNSLRLLTGLGLLLASTAGSAQAAIVYVPVNAGIFVSGSDPFKTRNYDLDSNGVNDITFLHTFVTSRAAGITFLDMSTRLETAGVGGGGTVNALTDGETVGPASSFATASYLFRVQRSTNSSGQILNETIIGPWQDGQAHFLGIRFDISGQTHYGWMRCVEGAPGLMIDYAYETTANAPVVVPAPMTLSMLLGLAALRNRRRV